MKKSKSKYRSAVKTSDAENVENVENLESPPVPTFQKSDKIVGKTGNLENESGGNHGDKDFHIL